MTRPCPLSPRQLECLDGLADGLTYEQIAKRCGIAITSVRSHLLIARRKLGVRDRGQAVILAAREGWIDPLGPPRELAARRAVERLAHATDRLVAAIEARKPLPPHQRAYLAAFDEMLYAKSDEERRHARAKMRESLPIELDRTDADPVEVIVSNLIRRYSKRT